MFQVNTRFQWRKICNLITRQVQMLQIHRVLQTFQVFQFQEAGI